MKTSLNPLLPTSTLENSSEFLVGFTDTEMCFLHTNRLFQKQFELENKTWKGQPFTEVIRTFQMEKLLQANHDCIKNPAKTASIEIQTISGENKYWFRWEISAMVNDEQKVEAVRFVGTDITKQKKTEQALLEQAILLDNISDAIVSSDQNFSIKSWNLKAEMMFNLRRDANSSNCFHDIDKISFVNDTEENFRKQLEENESWNGEVLIIKKDRTKFYLQSMINLIKDKAGNATGFVAVSRDITKEKEIKNKLEAQQKKSQLDLAREKQRFQSFMENAPLLAWIIDANGVLKYMNSRFKNVFGYSDTHLDKKIGTINEINDQEKVLLPHRDVIIKNCSIEFVHEWVCDKNETHYFRTFKFPIKDADGNILEGGQAIDITPELIAEKALKRGNELFEYAGKATRDVIWDWDVEENKINRTGGYQVLFGYEISEYAESHNYNKIHPDDLAYVGEVVKNAFANNDSRWQIEYRYLCADRTYKFVIDQAYIVRNKNGEPIRVIGSMQDVTEERNLQQQILMAEKQKKKDVVNAVIEAQEKERQELSAELHDNVNQLLAASILYLKTAQKQQTDEGTFIETSIDYLQKAVDEIRNISHNLTPAELKMDGLIPALKVFAKELHIPGSFEVSLTIKKLNEEKIASPVKLAAYRIIQEITNNILKHAEATKVTISLNEEKNNLKLTVTDNGKGFDQSSVKKGLGITNIMNRVENFGGAAEIISSPENGCSWNIFIPIMQS